MKSILNNANLFMWISLVMRRSRMITRSFNSKRIGPFTPLFLNAFFNCGRSILASLHATPLTKLHSK